MGRQVFEKIAFLQLLARNHCLKLANACRLLGVELCGLLVLDLVLEGLAAINSHGPSLLNSHRLVLSQDGQEEAFEKWRVENSWGEDRGNKGKVIYSNGNRKLNLVFGNKEVEGGKGMCCVSFTRTCMKQACKQHVGSLYSWKANILHLNGIYI